MMLFPRRVARASTVRASGASRRREFFRPRVEQLEDRRLLAALPPADLVSWYRAENNANDFAVGNHGILQNGAGFAAGRVGQAFSLDGVDDRVRVPHSPSLSLPRFTVDAWFRIDTNPDTTKFIVSKGTTGDIADNPGNNFNYRIDVFGADAGSDALKINGGFEQTDGTNQFVLGQTTINVGQLVHAALTYDGSTLKLYVNGVLDGQLATTAAPELNAQDVVIGGAVVGPNSLNNHFPGLIDEVEIHNRALTQPEIESIVAAGSEGKATQVVTTAADLVSASDAVLSLREAITASNTVAARDVIGFDIPNMPTDATSWWKAEGNANDSTDGNHGTPQGGVTFVPGKVGQAFNFDGTGAVNIPHNPNLDFGSGNFTIDAWVQFNSGTGTRVIYIKYAINPTYVLQTLTGNQANFSFRDGDGDGVSVTGTTALNDGAWHHIAGVREGTTGRLYVDGALQNSVTNVDVGSIITTGSPARIGGANTSNPPGAEASESFFTGQIDELDVFPRALSGPEVHAIFQAGSAGKVLNRPGLVSWYRAEDNPTDAGNDPTDGNHGTLQNGATFAAGQVGRAFDLTGALDRVAIPNNPNINFTTANDYSVDFWMKAGPQNITSDAAVIEKWDGTGSYPYVVRVLPSGSAAAGRVYAAAFDGTTDASVASTTRVDDDQWHYVAAVFRHSQKEMAIYVDGQLESTAAYSTLGNIGNSQTLLLGLRGNLLPGNDYNGLLDEVGIYNRPLSTGEIRGNFTAGSLHRPPTGVMTIQPTAALGNLPTISQSVIIDGYTQPGSTANTLAVGNDSVHLIELNGSNLLVSPVSGLQISSGGGGSTIRGLVINRFTGGGSEAIELNSNNNTIVGNYIGTNAAGTMALGNNNGINVGVALGTGGNNLIGTPAPADRNLISGNSNNGILLTNDTNTTNTVQNNYIGVNASGNADLGNGNIGVGIIGVFQATTQGATLIGGPTPTPGTGAGNVISGNNQEGIRFVNGDDNVLGPITIQGNIIGLGVDGTTVVGNGASGIDERTADGSTSGAVLIGGASPTLRNIISGNSGDGIVYADASATVQGNFIGTDVTGTLDRGNVFLGIEVVGDHRDPTNSANTTITIGGSGADEGNLISGNNAGGISIRNAISIIQGNLIGTQANGTSALGNTGQGVRITSLFENLVTGSVGGAADGAGNTIAHNASSGVSIDTNTTAVSILRNSIFNNGATTGILGLGIDLEPVGPQGNDAGDVDTGPNGRQNSPVLVSATTTVGTTTIMGTLNSTPGGTFRIEFFASAAADPSGFGEGQTFLGFTNTTTDASSGNVAFSFATPTPTGTFFTSTATRLDANLQPIETSEFSAVFVAQAAAPTVTINQAVGQADPTNDSPILLTVVFSTSVTGFDGGDVSFAGSTLSSLTSSVSGSGANYTVSVTGMNGVGTVVASIPAGAAVDDSNASSAASTSVDNSVTFDGLAPTVSINQAVGQADPTSSSPILFAVLFSESMTGFTGSDVSFVGSTAGGTLVASISGSGSSYTVAVTGMSSSGTVVASIGAGAASDLAGNLSAASTSSDNTVTFAAPVVAPTVTINQAAGQADPTNASPILFTVVFSTSVTDFTGSDVSFAGSTLSGLVALVSGSGASYTVSVTGMNGVGTVVASIPAGAAMDGSNASSAASTSIDNSVTFDGVAPTVTINQAVGQADPTSSSPILFAVLFSESMTGFTGSDVSFVGSTAGGTLVASVSGSGSSYTVAVTGMSSSGTVVASMGAGAASDLAGNLSAASTSSDNTVTFATAVLAPTVTINQAAGQADPTSSSPILFTVVFSTPVTGFAGSDVSFAGSTVGGTLVAGVSGSGATYTVSVTGMTGVGTVVATIPAGAAMDANNTSSAASTSIDNSVTVTTPVPQATTLIITLVARQAKFKNEFGLYFVDDAAGRIGTLAPGDRGYARAAIGRTKAVFTTRDKIGAKRTLNLPAGGFYGTYLVQNATRSAFLARNPFNRLNRKPLMFFSFAAANPDGFDHVRRPVTTRTAFEDQTKGGDMDFNDLIVDVRAQAAPLADVLSLTEPVKRK